MQTRMLLFSLGTKIFLSRVTHMDVEDIILSLDQSKSFRPQSIPVKLLTILGPRVSKAIAQLLINTFTKIVFPPNSS